VIERLDTPVSLSRLAASGGRRARVLGWDAKVATTKPCALSVVVPTRNEMPNIEVLVSRLTSALRTHPGGFELIFVDDSDDDTPDLIADLGDGGLPLRVLHRPAHGRPGGLGGAVRDGFAVAEGDIVVVMDGDLQHPPEVIPALVAPILAAKAELVVGSRYRLGGVPAGLSSPWRRGVSRASRSIVHLAVPRSRCLTDPLSGLFAVRRDVIEGVALRPDGFKILLEVVARGTWARCADVDYRFAHRYAGRSKANVRQGLVFARHLLRLVSLGRGPAESLGEVSRGRGSPPERSLARAR
jgi:glycosyltransferase involved in cell wall biosynthesis